jgi:hypothetical protein
MNPDPYVERLTANHLSQKRTEKVQWGLIYFTLNVRSRAFCYLQSVLRKLRTSNGIPIRMTCLLNTFFFFSGPKFLDILINFKLQNFSFAVLRHVITSQSVLNPRREDLIREANSCSASQEIACIL